MNEVKLKYSKPPLTLDEQIILLKTRGLIVENDNELKYYLKNISYYHLSIYFKHFQDADKFYNGVSFNDILRIYKFDNKLRFLLLELLERIEKSFKCRMAYELSIECGTGHWYLNKSFFVDVNRHSEILKIISDEVAKSGEISISHYKETYSEPPLPPIWNIIEILSFGQCVKICKSLKREYRNKISRTFGEDEKFILSWMHCLSALRNNCAHHSRLWNKVFNFTPNKSHNKYQAYFSTKNEIRLFDFLIVLQIILSKINPTSSWLSRLKDNISEFTIDTRSMGFPDDWETKFNKIIADSQSL